MNMFLSVPEISREHVHEHVLEIDLCVLEFVNMSLKTLISRTRDIAARIVLPAKFALI